MKFFGGVGRVPRTKWLQFGGDPDHDHKFFKGYTKQTVLSQSFIRQVAALVSVEVCALGAPLVIIVIALRKTADTTLYYNFSQQESPAVADKPARSLRNVCTVYVRAAGL